MQEVQEELVQHSQQLSVTSGGRSIDDKKIVNNRVGVGQKQRGRGGIQE